MLTENPTRRFPPLSELVMGGDDFLLASLLTEKLGTLREELKNGKINVVILTVIAGAGHLRQALRLLSTIAGDDDQSLRDRIPFIVIDPTTNKGKARAFFKIYALLQRSPIVRLPFILLAPFFNSSFFRDSIDNQIKSIAEQNIQQIMEFLEDYPGFNPSNPSIFLATHSVGAQAAGEIMKQRKNPNDLIIEFVPDPWKGGSLRSMTAPAAEETTGKWIVVVHDERTAREYQEVRPNSEAMVLPLGTISNPIYLKRREELRQRKVKLDGEEKKEKSNKGCIDVIIECAGNYIPNFDRRVSNFIISNAEAIRKGLIRLVIDPMVHEKSYKTFINALKKAGLTDNGNVLLLPPEKDLITAVKRREEVLEGKNEATAKFYPNPKFDPDVVIAKGGEVPLEDRANMIVLCIYASAPHEEEDIETGVSEGRVVDARKIRPSQWYEILQRLVGEERELPPPSLAVLAPGLYFFI